MSLQKVLELQIGSKTKRTPVNKVLRDVMPSNLVYLLSFHPLNLLHLVVYVPRMPSNQRSEKDVVCVRLFQEERERHQRRTLMQTATDQAAGWTGASISKTLFSVFIERFSFQGR